jgi:hypothetical protein
MRTIDAAGGTEMEFDAGGTNYTDSTRRTPRGARRFADNSSATTFLQR